MNLRPYQVEGAAWLSQKRTALLADAMRLGKSAQAVHASCLATDMLDQIHVGVVCPASVVPVWHEQFDAWWMEEPGKLKLHVASYDKVARGAFDGQSFDVLILDEAHYLKNKDALRTKKILGERCDRVGGLVWRAGRVWCLTGTPTPNHPAELWPVLHALAPETIQKGGKPMNYWSFVNTYCKTVDNGFGVQITGGKNLPKLRAAIEPFTLRRKYEDVAGDMPAMQFDVLPVAGMAPDEGEMAALLKGCETDDEVLSRLKAKGPHIASLRRLTGLAKVKGVIDWLRDWFDGEGGKIVLFAHHKDVIQGLVDGAAGIVGEVARVDGSMAQHERALAIRHFRERPECKVFVGQIQAAGTGIDLSEADTLVFVENDWVPGNNEQAAMRIQKVGKTAMNQVFMATLPGSVDEQIQRACLRKVRDSLEIFG